MPSLMPGVMPCVVESFGSSSRGRRVFPLSKELANARAQRRHLHRTPQRRIPTGVERPLFFALGRSGKSADAPALMPPRQFHKTVRASGKVREQRVGRKAAEQLRRFIAARRGYDPVAFIRKEGLR
jgi:hypothetical protein